MEEGETMKLKEKGQKDKLWTPLKLKHNKYVVNKTQTF